jgi:nicotinate-nucleotide--dimethylbenzimidazole phosphoribosyltransferase
VERLSGEFPEAEHLVRRKAVPGTRNMVREAALTRTEALQCLGTGIAMARRYAVPGPALYAAGEMGIGNTTAAAAITTIVTGEPARVVTGRGTGIDDRTLEKKIRLVERAIEVNQPDPRDPLDVLSKVGGAEIGAIAGLCLGAAERGIPVILDGFISTSGALIACGLNRYVKDFLFAAHQSREPGHKAALAHLGLRPIFDLDLRLGEGTGAVLAMHLLEAALKICTEMATFEEAGVSDQG